MKKIKVVFMGTPLFCIPILEGLIENYDVMGVVTQPDKEIGRHKEIKYSPVKELALKNNIQVFKLITKRTIEENKKGFCSHYCFESRFNCNLCLWTNSTKRTS